MSSSKEVPLSPERFGIPTNAVGRLSRIYQRFIQRFQKCFTSSRIGNLCHHAKTYLKGLLLMDSNRNYANIARRVLGVENDGQNLQHFMSDSPWKEGDVFNQIQQEIKSHPELDEGVLILDETSFEKDGDQSAGAARQYLGRLGKVDMGQVGVALCYHEDGLWAMVDAELYMPEKWFDDAHGELRRRYHVPEELKFRSKIDMGMEMIRQAKSNKLPFNTVLADSFYGRKHQFRADLDALGTHYIADIRDDMAVYTESPVVGVPEPKRNKKGAKPKKKRVLKGIPVNVKTFAKKLKLKTVNVRHSERGVLQISAAAARVWTLTRNMEVRQEWLLVWKAPDGTLGLALSNLPEDTSLEVLVSKRAERYFIERLFEDQKTDNGWDEFQARKYRAWQHQAAMQAMAIWFIALVKLDFKSECPKDPKLLQEFELEILPSLSTAGVRELMKAGMPLPRISEEDAVKLVTTHLFNRARSTSSRRRNQRGRSP